MDVTYRMTPVSYTHLDVYKRQIRHYDSKVLGNQELSRFIQKAGRDLGYPVDIIVQNYGGGEAHEIHRLFDGVVTICLSVPSLYILSPRAPVSYTHLDVYKRQGSGMAEVSNDQDLLLGFARKSGFHHIQISIIDTGLHLAHHLGAGGLGGILLMLDLHLPNESGQLVALTGCQNEAKNVGLG